MFQGNEDSKKGKQSQKSIEQMIQQLIESPQLVNDSQELQRLLENTDVRSLLKQIQNQPNQSLRGDRGDRDTRDRGMDRRLHGHGHHSRSRSRHSHGGHSHSHSSQPCFEHGSSLTLLWTSWILSLNLEFGWPTSCWYHQ